MTAPITIAIPVGPNPANVQWLHEALESIEQQTELPGEVLLIDDGAHLDPARYPGCRIWATPWPSGVAHAFNAGVALAAYDLVIMLGSDDRLLPHAVATCWQFWQGVQDPHGYYAMPVVYDDGREQLDPCNAAMVHKDLWKLTGGFPVEAAIGACDTWLISKIWVGKGTQGSLYTVGDGPLYWYRDHAATDTHQRAATWDLLVAYRDLWLRRAVPAAVARRLRLLAGALERRPGSSPDALRGRAGQRAGAGRARRRVDVRAAGRRRRPRRACLVGRHQRLPAGGRPASRLDVHPGRQP